MKTFVINILCLMLFLMTGCEKNHGSGEDDIDYRQAMRDFVIALSNYSKEIDNSFLIIPQNGQELITDNGETEGVIKSTYINAIDGTGREDLFFGYENDDEETPDNEKAHLLKLCRLFLQNNITVLTTDYCSTHSKMDSSYAWNEKNGFISFAADQRNLNNIPDYPETPFNMNANDITKISDAKNFLYLINSEKFSTKQEFIDAISNTNYDIILMDLFHNEEILTKEEIEAIKVKQKGGSRLVICYLSIGEAEDYRYYWQSEWKTHHPDWLTEENPHWAGNYKVKYWDNEWQDIIYGNNDSYLKKILDAGFNGVYLDIIDAYEYFE